MDRKTIDAQMAALKAESAAIDAEIEKKTNGLAEFRQALAEENERIEWHKSEAEKLTNLYWGVQAYKQQLAGIRKELRGRRMPSTKRLDEMERQIDAGDRLLKTAGVDPQTYSERRAGWRRFRRCLILALFIAAFLEFGGLPHLRIHTRYSPAYGRSSEYWSVTGRRQVSSEQLGDGNPLIVLLPLETSLTERGKAAVASGWRYLQSTWNNWRNAK